MSEPAKYFEKQSPEGLGTRPNSAAMFVQVIGCGSANGDDAVAWEVVRRLRDDRRVPCGVKLQCVAGGEQLLDRFESHRTLIVVDAVSSDAEPGRIYRLEWPDPRLESKRSGTTHSMRPAEALALAHSLGMLGPRVIVFGVEVGYVEPGAGLSRAVEEAIPRVIEQILWEFTEPLPTNAKAIE